MKAIIPKDKLRGSSIIIDQESLEHSEETIKRTWAEFSDALARKDFDYTDTDTALAVTFLKQFDKWFQGIGKTEMSLTLSECFNRKFVGRGTIIKPSEPEDLPPYERFIPISKFITADNRFSPAGIEWLYLAVGDTQEIIQECAEKECRVKRGERFAFCNFQINENYSNVKVVDLTIADELSYEDINDRLRAVEQREYEKSLKYARKNGFWMYRLHQNNDQDYKDRVQQDIAKWVLHTYAKMMSKNIFVPIETEDKKLEYAPFQTLAMYFIREGFDGIVYSSTVCPTSKNLVLFDKKYAIPFDLVKDYTFNA